MSKKIIGIAICMMLVASFAFAKELGTMISDADLSAELSNAVSGDYFVDVNAAGDPIAFSASTVHAQGSRAYATGSFITAIYYKPTGDAVASDDLLGEPTAYDSSASFIGGGEWKVMGE